MAPADCSSARRLWVAQPAARRLMRPGLRTERELRTGPKTAAVAVYVLASRRGSCCAGSWCVLFETYEVLLLDRRITPTRFSTRPWSRQRWVETAEGWNALQ